MHPDNANLTDVTFYIDGEEIGQGIPDFECSYEDLRAEMQKGVKYNLDPEGSFTGILAFKKLDMLVLAKLFGVWQWVYDLCPNRRVIHLMQHGKNHKIKKKNFIRACVITAKCVAKGV